MEDIPMIKIGALWNPHEGSKAHLSGKFGDAQVLVIKNGFKKAENQPDYIIYVASPRKKPESKPEDTTKDFPF